ncbi:MAG: YhgE/Pip domain-containing protein [Glaciihabitans sp.]
MSQTPSLLPRRRARRFAAIATVIVLPLAFAGLAVASASQANDGLDQIPAAIVNNDEMVTTTLPDGTEQQTLAGRLLVTELTGADSPGFEWTITNSDAADEMLADGEVYAVLEVDPGFSESIVSLSSDSPQQAQVSIRTDDSHDYLTGSVAQIVGDSMVAAFGEPITQQYIGGLYSSIGSLGDALSAASDGASQLSGGASQLTDGATALTDGAAAVNDGANALAGGVGQLSNGAGELAGGLSSLSDGAATASAGAGTLAAGVGQYTAGVTELSGGVTEYVAGVGQLADGLQEFEDQASALDASTVGVTQYTEGVTQAADGLSQLIDLIPVVEPVPQTDPGYPAYVAYLALRGPLDQLATGLETASASGPLVVEGVNTAFSQLAAGAATSSAGADQLAAAGSELVAGANTLSASGAEVSSGAGSLASGLTALQSGASSATAGANALADGASELATGSGTLATGTEQLASGTGAIATGAGELATGAGNLASGLASGAQQIPAMTDDQATEAAEVATSPIGLNVERDNEVSDFGQILATFFVPLGLWIGALAVFLVMRPISSSILSSTATGGRIALSATVRASALTGAQAVLLTGLLHVTLDVSWTLLPATLLFSVLMAVSFTAFHYFLTAALGRAGLVVSLLLLAFQITATGSLYPIELLAPFFQVVSPFLPLTYAVDGMHAIIAGSDAGSVLLSVLALVAFGALSLGASLLAVGRSRKVRGAEVVKATA